MDEILAFCTKFKDAAPIFSLVVPPFVAALVVAIGWNITAHFNRKHEMFKKRTEIRAKLLEDYIRFFDKILINPSVINDEKDDYNQICGRFNTYGMEDEIALIDRINTALINTQRLNEADLLFHELVIIITDRLRNDIGLPRRKRPPRAAARR